MNNRLVQTSLASAFARMCAARAQVLCWASVA